MGHRFESCRAHQIKYFLNLMHKTIIKNIQTGIEKNCDILKKNNYILEVVLENTTIKILLKNKNGTYVGKYKNMEFILLIQILMKLN